MLAGIGSVAAGTPLIGCSTTAAIAAGHSPGGSGVFVVAFGGPGFSVTTGISRDVDGRQRDAGIDVASCVTGLADRPHQALVVLRVFFEIHPPTVPYRSPGFRFPATDSDHMARPACDSWCGETAEARV